MLKTRIITALLLIPLTLGILFYAPLKIFFLFTTILLLLGAWEWTDFMQLTSLRGRIAYEVFIILAGLLAALLPVMLVLKIAFVWWCSAIVFVLRYPKMAAWWGNGTMRRGAVGALILIPWWIALNAIRAQEAGVYALLYVLLLIWGADTFAYFVGKRLGKHKLAPAVSPGKSIEGAMAALVGAVLITWGALYLSATPAKVWLACYMLGLVVTFFSIVGDLMESAMKRQAGIKDSGKMIPGHGGLLDRIDSLTAALPIFLLGVMWLSHIS